MKLRMMTWARWLEILWGLILPLVTVLPYLIAGVSDRFIHYRTLLDIDDFLGLYITISFVIVLVSLAFLIFFGPEQVNRRPVFLRWVFIIIGVFGLLMVGFLMSQAYRMILIRDLRYLVLFILAGPFVVGFRYLVKLLKGKL